MPDATEQKPAAAEGAVAKQKGAKTEGGSGKVCIALHTILLEEERWNCLTNIMPHIGRCVLRSMAMAQCCAALKIVPFVGM